MYCVFDRYSYLLSTLGRHLLKRIEEPMKQFESNQNVLAGKDAKRIIKVGCCRVGLSCTTLCSQDVRSLVTRLYLRSATPVGHSSTLTTRDTYLFALAPCGGDLEPHAFPRFL